MYPINAASPQRIAIGAVVQISDGAVQTSGVSVKVLPQGGAAAGSGGTVAYEEGIVHYTPTQAETNYTSFILIAYKTGCIPATVTVVTSASTTAGYAGLDWAKVTAPTSTVGLTNTTVGTLTTYTGNTPQTGDSFARIGATGSGLTTLATQASVNTIDDLLDTEIAAIKADTAAILLDTGTDGVVVAAASKSGYSLTATTGLGNQTANITGTISTVTNLTNAPTAGDLTATMKTSVTTAATAATPTVLLTSGTGTGQVALASGIVDANVQKINDVTITGNGVNPNEFGV
jgi:hypothetical protein